MTGLTVIFRTPSQIEADVVRGLLETHGIRTIVSSDMSRTPFPLAVNELRIAVHDEEADRASRIIASHREESGPGRVVPFGSELEPLERQIGYRFKDRGLLEHALTHRSRVHEDASGGVFDNESMEFLGDSVLGFVIADMLFRQFPQHNEGQKSKLKASIVSAASLARLGERINLGEFLILGRGEEKTGGRRKLALISDCYEALIAAIYLDGGIEPARTFIERQFASLIQEARRTGAHATFTEDYKSALQEWLQSHDRGLPAYRLAGEIGPAHRRLFDVEVVVNGVPVARAEGKSKKEAAQAAAKLALDRLSSEG
ncbi:MAG TPA: ribonuclease III [Vicinamibacterales bacterium]|jgi:ribonuclease-3|nr:ribonuclease III [Vicinamibacterales bacterium]